MPKLAVVSAVFVLAGCTGSAKLTGEADTPAAAEAIEETTTTTAPPPTRRSTTTTPPTTEPEFETEWEGDATKPEDITDRILAANEFNEPPPEGWVYAGFHIRFTLEAATEGTASPGVDWLIELEGPNRYYDQYSETSGCGVFPDDLNQLDEYADLKPGGTVEGWYCIPVPAAELDQVKVVVNDWTGNRFDVKPAGG